MDSRKLNDWLQILGIFGVMAGIAFVGLELRQDRRIALASAVDAYAAEQRAWAGLISENGEVWRKGLAGEPLEAIEKQTFESMAEAWSLFRYGAWFRASETVSEVSTSQFVGETAIMLCENPGLRLHWRYLNELSGTFNAGENSYADAVEEEIADFGDDCKM
jgi:hypothetical protein